MSLQPIAPVSVTQVVYDIMMVHVNCSSLLQSEIRYAVVNQSNRLIRKGQFTGAIVQLRMAHLEDGLYHFNMFIKEKLYSDFPFEKKTLAA